MKKLFVIPVIIVMLLGALVLGSCGEAEETTTSAPPSPIKIGHIIDLTGPEAVLGQIMETSLQLAFDDIGNQIAGHPVEIIVGDAQGQPSVAVDIARKMVEQDGVVAIFGPTQIGEKFAVAGYIAQAGIPMIFYSPTPLNLFQGDTANKWVIGALGSTAMQPTCMGDYLYNHMGYRTINTLTQDNSAGHAFLDPLMEVFEANGGQVVQSQWVPVPCPDFAPYLTTLEDADAFVAWDTGADAIALHTQYYQLGIGESMPFVGAFHGACLDPFIVMALPADVAASVVGDITVMTYAPDSQDPVNQAFIESFTAKMGFPPGDDGAAGPYHAAVAFIEAVKSTNGDTTPDTLLTAITQVNITGPQGPILFTSGSTCATMNIYIIKVTQFAPDVYGYTTIYTYENVPPTGYTGE